MVSHPGRARPLFPALLPRALQMRQPVRGIRTQARVAQVREEDYPANLKVGRPRVPGTN